MALTGCSIHGAFPRIRCISRISVMLTRECWRPECCSVASRASVADRRGLMECSVMSALRWVWLSFTYACVLWAFWVSVPVLLCWMICVALCCVAGWVFLFVLLRWVLLVCEGSICCFVLASLMGVFIVHEEKWAVMSLVGRIALSELLFNVPLFSLFDIELFFVLSLCTDRNCV